MAGTHDEDGERIAKVIARAGLASRREAEEWIAAGRVAVNGAVIHSPALNVSGRDLISVDDQTLLARGLPPNTAPVASYLHRAITGAVLPFQKPAQGFSPASSASGGSTSILRVCCC